MNRILSRQLIRGLFFLAAVCLLFSGRQASADIKLKMIVVNPSDTEARTVPAKSYLPKGVTPEDITDRGNFEVSYDFEKSLYYIYQEVKINPKEAVTLEVAMRDIWIIPDRDIKALKDHTVKIIGLLRNTEYYKQAKMLADNITIRIDKISEIQNEPEPDTEQKISDYETNFAVLTEVKKDIGILEDLAIEAGVITSKKLNELMGEDPIDAQSFRIEALGLDIAKLGTVKFKIQFSNSSSEQKTMPIKYYLPVEVKPAYIMLSGGLDMAYDNQKGVYYVFKDSMEFAPQEKKEFTVEVKDIWIIPQQQIDFLKSQVRKWLGILEESEYKESAKFLGDKIIAGLDVIIDIQNTAEPSVERHIGNFRSNVKRFMEAKKAAAKLEKLVMQAGGSPEAAKLSSNNGNGSRLNRSAGRQTTKGMEMVAKTMFRGKAPDTSTSWKIIWTVVGFMAVVSFLFFILWWLQIKKSETKNKENINQEKK